MSTSATRRPRRARSRSTARTSSTPSPPGGSTSSAARWCWHRRRGAWLTDAHGHELLDAFAGLWCVNVGYGQESVVQAATAQLRQLPYATGYFGFASEPAIRLAAKLAEITPASLTRAYLTLGGSEAVDAAVRFIVQYWNARGRPARSTSSRSSAATTARRPPAPA